MIVYRNRTFYHIAGCLCLVVCESEHATLLWLLVTSPTLVVSSLLTLVVLLLIVVLLLTRVLLPLLALGVLWRLWLLLVRGPLLAQLVLLQVLGSLLVLLGLWSWWPGCVTRCLWAIPNKVIGTPATVAPVVGQVTLLYTMSRPTASSASDGSWLLNLLRLWLWVTLLRSLTLAPVFGEASCNPAG